MVTQKDLSKKIPFNKTTDPSSGFPPGIEALFRARIGFPYMLDLTHVDTKKLQR